MRSNSPVQVHSSSSLKGLWQLGNGGYERIVHAGLLCTDEMLERVLALKNGQVLMANDKAIAMCGQGLQGHELNDIPPDMEEVEVGHKVYLIERPWHIFQFCAQSISLDFELLTKGRASQKLSDTNTVIGDSSLVFLEEGAEVEASNLNTKNGPIYIGKDAVVMEGCNLRGPISLGEKSQMKMATKVYGASAFGPQCRIGGEVNNSVMFGYSNKGHDGFLGNSVLGEWCNLGADTNNSNLKNNYGEVRIYGYAEQNMLPTGLQFCGLIMGDHSKAGINTMFNTGTVVGVCANVFGGGFPPKHIPSFAWGGADGFVSYDFDKAIATAQAVMNRRGVEPDQDYMDLLKDIKATYGLGS